MDKVRLGRSELMVSKLGFGSIPIQRLSEDDAMAVIRRCLELGIIFIDTANAYTTSEERVGKAILGRRQDLILATKSASRNHARIEEHIQLSLKRLGVEYLDLFQFHQIGTLKELDMVLDAKGLMCVAEKFRKQGIVKHIGITTHQLDVAKEAVNTDRFETVMFPFNFIACEAADELLFLTRKHDVGFIAMKPLGGGMLDNATLAFKYLFQYPDVVPIPGIERICEIDEIVEILKGPHEITEAEQQDMLSYRDELGKKFCRRCDYCQPCTEGISISRVMVMRSMFKRLPAERVFSERHARTMEKAANCSECGDCEERCPYNLPIREMIAETVEWYQAEKRKFEEYMGPR